MWVWFCFGVSRKPRGSFAEAPRKEHMPKQRYSLPMPSQSPSPRQTNVASKRKRPKRKQMKAQQAKMKGTETDHNQKPWKRSGAVVAEAKTRKTRSRKLAEGLYVKCVSRKLALWSRKLLRKRWIISFPPQRKKEQNSCGLRGTFFRVLSIPGNTPMLHGTGTVAYILHKVMPFM